MYEIKKLGDSARAIARGTEELALYGALTVGALAVGTLMPGTIAHRNQTKTHEARMRRDSAERDLAAFSLRWLDGAAQTAQIEAKPAAPQQKSEEFITKRELQLVH